MNGAHRNGGNGGDHANGRDHVGSRDANGRDRAGRDANGRDRAGSKRGAGGAHDGQARLAAGAVAKPYSNGTYSDTRHVDAASDGTAHGNGAYGGKKPAGAAARSTPNGDGAYSGDDLATALTSDNVSGANGRDVHRSGEPLDGAKVATNGIHGLRHGNRSFGARDQASRTGVERAGDGAYVPTDGANVSSRASVSSGGIGMAGSRGGQSVTFGFGETAGVLPGDQRTFDDVEAGIVALWRQFGEGRAQPLRDRLVLHYAPLVKYVAGRVGTGLPAHVEVADLIQSGIFGLVDAIEKFEPERGLKFETYAMQRIRGAILDDLRAQDWVPRSVRGRAREVERALERLGAQLRRTPTDAELADELGLSLHELRDVYAQLQLTSVVALDELAAAGRGPTPLADILEDQEALDPVALLVDQDNRRQLAQAIAHLAERDRVVVTLYYFENLTLAEIGRVLGVTESRVCQLHTRAVLRLRAKLLEKTDA
jgi:RNA polymerase sigma factor FliA